MPFWASSLFIPDLFPGDLVICPGRTASVRSALSLYLACAPTSHPCSWQSVTLCWGCSGASPTHSSAQGVLELQVSCCLPVPAQHFCSILATLAAGQRPVLLTVTALNPRPLGTFIILHFPGITKGYFFFFSKKQELRNAGTEWPPRPGNRMLCVIPSALQLPRSGAGCLRAWTGYLSEVSCKAKMNIPKSTQGDCVFHPQSQPQIFRIAVGLTWFLCF